MFGIDVKSEFRPERIVNATDRAVARILPRRAALIQKTAQDSILTSDEPSAPGSPPHTRGEPGQNIRDAIITDVGNDDALIGMSHAVIGDVGEAMEFGGQFRGFDFDARPTMGPALDANIDPFVQDFEGSIGE